MDSQQNDQNLPSTSFSSDISPAVEETKVPEDVTEEILSNLQVKDVVRFKSVCKSWFSTISTPRFINLHLNRSISTPSHHRIFMPFRRTYKTIDYHGNHQLRVTEQPIPKETIEKYFAGTSNGLICYLDHGAKSIFVWNPALGESKTLNTDITVFDWDIPFEQLRYYNVSFFWFGLNPIDNEYTLIVGIRSLEDEGTWMSHAHLVRPYSSDGNSTIEIYDDGLPVMRFFKDGPGTLSHGVVHWLSDEHSTADYSRTLFTYDLGGGTMGEVRMPVSCRGSIGEIDGCLSAITLCDDGSVEVWMMKEYGMMESWTKSVIISRSSIGCDHRTSSLSRLVLVGVDEDGDLILSSCAPVVELLIYNVQEKKLKTLVSNGYGLPRMYVETLVSP